MRYRTEVTVRVKGRPVVSVQTERVRTAAIMWAHQEAQDERTIRVEVWEMPELDDAPGPAARRILFYDFEPER